MGRSLLSFDCADCSKPTTRKVSTGDPRVCLDCGIERAARAAREMSARSGPAWDKFLRSPGANGRPPNRSQK